MPSSLNLFPGMIAEYRESGKLLGVMTGVLNTWTWPKPTMLLQHVMLWPGAPKGALIRMLVEAEQRVWADFNIDQIMLDVEHSHPFAAKLRRLARLRGFIQHSISDSTTWFVKERST